MFAKKLYRKVLNDEIIKESYNIRSKVVFNIQILFYRENRKIRHLPDQYI